MQTKPKNIDFSWIQKDTQCWIYLPDKHPSKNYFKAIIRKVPSIATLKRESKVTVEVQMDQLETIEAKAELLEQASLFPPKVTDLTDLELINTAEVMQLLKTRLLTKHIYTNLWTSLIIVNPYKVIDELYDEKSMTSYYNYTMGVKSEAESTGNSIVPQVIHRIGSILNDSQPEPHIYYFTMKIIKNAFETGKPQSVSIGGESGSGKTETNKQCLKAVSYFFKRLGATKGDTTPANSARSISSAYDKPIEEKILECDPILESFGNSKTVKNDNSSRFGKLVTLYFSKKPSKITGIGIRNFFIEKSRIIKQEKGERNFHIFYQLLKHGENELKAKLRLKNKQGVPFRISDFSYLTQKDSSEAEMNQSDLIKWKALHQALDGLKFPKQITFQIFQSVAAVLLLGNIQFDGIKADENNPCIIMGEDFLDAAASNLMISPVELRSLLLFQSNKFVGEVIRKPMSKNQCEEARNSIAKGLYDLTFQRLVDYLTKSIPSTSGDSCLKNLDIYGFETFERNSFEQLCVNFTNECLHQVYLGQIFIEEKKIFQKEGREDALAGITFTDNAEVIKLLDKNVQSIFNILDEICRVNSMDDRFLDQIRQVHAEHQNFSQKNKNNVAKSFIIIHTPGEIEYQISGFCDKNKDYIKEDSLITLSNSKNSIIRTAFSAKITKIQTQGNVRFLGASIRREVNELIREMADNSDFHFIRCIKPNDQKKPLTFTDKMCYNQIRYLGILDAIDLRKESYHFRILYQEFLAKYGALNNKTDVMIQLWEGKLSSADAKKETDLLLRNTLRNYALQFLLGKERVFLKISSKNFLDKKLALETAQKESSASFIKTTHRLYTSKRRVKQIITNAKKVQKIIRAFLIRSELLRKKNAVRTIEVFWKNERARYYQRRKQQCMQVLQMYTKRLVAFYKIDSYRKQLSKLNHLLKTALCTSKFATKYENFSKVRQVVQKQLLNIVWQKIFSRKLKTINRYLPTFAVRKLNQTQINKALNVYRFKGKKNAYKTLEKYIKSFANFLQVQRRIRSLKLIGSTIRGGLQSNKFTQYRKKIIAIQQAWRRLHKDKIRNIEETEAYFNSNLAYVTKVMKSLLFRSEQKQRVSPIEKMLIQMDGSKRDKNHLFYYLLDIQMNCELSMVYPDLSWVHNYLTVWQQALVKGCPILWLDIADTHTIAVTVNQKVYTWGYPQNPSTQVTLLTQPAGCKIYSVVAGKYYTALESREPDDVIIYGDRARYDKDISKWATTLNEKYHVKNGILRVFQGTIHRKIPFNEKVSQISCGQRHCVALTSLKKVYTWGSGLYGELGHGNFKTELTPMMVAWISSQHLTIRQVSATLRGTQFLDDSCRVWWCGTNGTISRKNLPEQCILSLKSEVIDNPSKYSIVRLIPRWSNNLCVLGVVVVCHDANFRAQAPLRRKVLESLMIRWMQEPDAVFPPYMPNIAGYFSERFMPMRNQYPQSKPRKDAVDPAEARERLLEELRKIERSEQELLAGRDKGYYY